MGFNDPWLFRRLFKLFWVEGLQDSGFRAWPRESPNTVSRLMAGNAVQGNQNCKPKLPPTCNLSFTRLHVVPFLLASVLSRAECVQPCYHHCSAPELFKFSDDNKDGNWLNETVFPTASRTHACGSPCGTLTLSLQ